MIIFLPNHVKKCLNQLNSQSFSAFCVGGAVRDALLGETPYDYDVATSATPEQVIGLFDKVIPTGIKHGTVTVIIDDHAIEVTTFRTDGNYADSRHPENVCFVGDINSDLSRRDFTVNAFAYSNDGTLIDNFNGAVDLKEKTIRCVGDPQVRFTEDALRILRAFRFCSTLDFNMEESTKKYALKLASSLSNISRERIYVELTKLLCGKKPQVITELLSADVPEFLKAQYINQNIFNMIGKINSDKDIRFAFFCLATGIDPTYLFENLKADNKTKQSVETLLQILHTLPFKSKIDIKKALANISAEKLCDLTESYGMVFKINTTDSINEIKQIVANGEPYLIKHLKVGGNDILLCGAKEKEIGQTLNHLLNIVLENPSHNEKEILTEAVKKYLKI